MLSRLSLAISIFLAGTSPALAGAKVVALDQCADQYVLALVPRTDILGLSTRSDNLDSWLRAEAKGLPRRRATVESLLAARPDIAIGYWGGSPALDRQLMARSVRVIRIDDAIELDGVMASIRKVALALGQSARGEALILDMQHKLDAASGRGAGRSILYVTPGGVTAGPGTLIDAMLRAAGYRNDVTRPGYSATPLEQLVLHPPAAVVSGFFDADSSKYQHWSPGGHALLTQLVKSRAVVRWPGAMLTCPAWFAADAVERLGRAR